MEAPRKRYVSKPITCSRIKSRAVHLPTPQAISLQNLPEPSVSGRLKNRVGGTLHTVRLQINKRGNIVDGRKLFSEWFIS